MGICFSEQELPQINPDKVDLTHFEILKVVGRGAFGKVSTDARRVLFSERGSRPFVVIFNSRL